MPQHNYKAGAHHPTGEFHATQHVIVEYIAGYPGNKQVANTLVKNDLYRHA